MKVKRQNLSESYITTVDWINDFNKSIAKNSSVDPYGARREKFSNIKDKMEDLKSRVGFFDVDMKKEAGCGCNKCDECSKGLKDKVVVMLKLIDAIIKNEPDLNNPRSVIERGKEHMPQIESIPLDRPKLLDLISSKMKKDDKMSHDPVSEYNNLDRHNISTQEFDDGDPFSYLS